jgi:hypothetical protein
MPVAVALLFAGLLLLATGARAETPSLVVDPARSDVEMTLEIVFLGSDSDTQPVTFGGSATADVFTEEHATFGRVARTLQFLASDVVVADTTFDLVLPSFTVTVETQGLAGGFTQELLQAEPLAPGTSTVALTGLDLELDAGVLLVTVTPPGTAVEMDVAEAPFVFALGDTGVITSSPAQGRTDFELEIPVTETASAEAEGITVNLTLTGSLVLVGAGAVPALSPPAMGLLAILLALGGGLAAARGTAPHRP